MCIVTIVVFVLGDNKYCVWSRRSSWSSYSWSWDRRRLSRHPVWCLYHSIIIQLKVKVLY